MILKENIEKLELHQENKRTVIAKKHALNLSGREDVERDKVEHEDRKQPFRPVPPREAERALRTLTYDAAVPALQGGAGAADGSAGAPLSGRGPAQAGQRGAGAVGAGGRGAAGQRGARAHPPAGDRALRGKNGAGYCSDSTRLRDGHSEGKHGNSRAKPIYKQNLQEAEA